MGKQGIKEADIRAVEETVSLPIGLRDYLRYLGQVDGLSVPQVIRTMIDNGVRQRKATDPSFREYTKRSR